MACTGTTLHNLTRSKYMPTRDINNFRIAEFGVRIIFEKKGRNSMNMLPSFDPFRVDELSSDEFLFELTVDDSLRPMPKKQRERIRDFDTGNGITIVDALSDGGYQYIIRTSTAQTVAC